MENNGLKELIIEPITAKQRTQRMAKELFDIASSGVAPKSPWTEAQFMDTLEVEHSIILTAKYKDKYVAFLIASQQLFEVEIYLIVVREEYKKQKIGEQLLLHLRKMAKRRNSETIFLEVRPSNKPARRLYEKLHFQEIGSRKAYYSSPIEDAILMKLDL